MLCTKSFKNEFYLDKHMGLKHQDVVNASSTVCLADLCPVFGCSYYKQKEDTAARRNRQTSADDKKTFSAIEPCTDEALMARKLQCDQILSS
jgi:hypothetical protein